MRRRLTLIILAAVLVAAIILTVVVTRQRTFEATGAEEAPEEQRIEISVVDPQEVREIELLSAERQLRLSKQGGGWHVEHLDPIDLDPIDLNPAAIEDLVYTFARLVAEKVIELEPENLKQFGLDPPQVLGKATMADGSVIELRLGDLTPIRNTYYLTKAGDPAVYAVWANHGLHLLYSLDDLRNKELPRMIAAKKQKVLYFDAHDDVPYGTAVEVMDLARAASALAG